MKKIIVILVSVCLAIAVAIAGVKLVQKYYVLDKDGMENTTQQEEVVDETVLTEDSNMMLICRQSALIEYVKEQELETNEDMLFWMPVITALSTDFEVSKDYKLHINESVLKSYVHALYPDSDYDYPPCEELVDVVENGDLITYLIESCTYGTLYDAQVNDIVEADGKFEVNITVLDNVDNKTADYKVYCQYDDEKVSDDDNFDFIVTGVDKI